MGTSLQRSTAQPDFVLKEAEEMIDVLGRALQQGKHIVKDAVTTR
jgi:hypothetical protein